MKRFYKLVSISQKPEGWMILLDGKEINTPSRNSKLSAPSEALANAIMEEWAAQSDVVVPDTMPLTQILNTKIDRVANERSVMSDMILKYFNTDLVFYRVDQPEELAKRQMQVWGPHVRWFEEKFACDLETTTGLNALTQEDKAHEAVGGYVQALDDDHFTVLQLVVSICGSLVLGVAFVERELSAADAFKAIRVEENYKAEIYNEALHGQDPAQEKKDTVALDDLKAAEQYLRLLA